MGYATHAYKLAYTSLVAFTKKGQKKKSLAAWELSVVENKKKNS